MNSRHKIHRQENYYILLLAAIQFVHILDFVIMMPLGPVIMSKFSINSTQFGALVSSYNYSAAAFLVVFSVISDRFNRKSMLLVSLSAFTIGTFACGFSTDYKMLLITRILTGAFGGILNGIVLAIVADIVPYKRRGKAMGLIATAFSVSSVIGIPIGLTLSDFFGWSSTFIFIGVLSVFVTIVAKVILPSIEAGSSCESYIDVIKKYHLVLFKKDYFVAFCYIFIVAFSMFIVIPFLSPYAVNNIGIKTHEIKYAYFFAGICTIITAQIFGKLTDKYGASKMFIIIGTCSIAPVWLFTNAPKMHVVYYVLMSILFMTLASGRMIPAMTLISKVPTKAQRGRFMSILTSVRSFASATATLLGGFIITELPSGEFKNYDHNGYVAIFFILLSFVFLNPLKKVVCRISKEESDSLDTSF